MIYYIFKHIMHIYENELVLRRCPARCVRTNQSQGDNPISLSSTRMSDSLFSNRWAKSPDFFANTYFELPVSLGYISLFQIRCWAALLYHIIYDGRTNLYLKFYLYIQGIGHIYTLNSTSVQWKISHKIYPKFYIQDISITPFHLLNSIHFENEK